MSYIIGPKEDVDAIVRADNADRGLPVRGTHVGGGKHVPMTDDPTSPGWTRSRFDVLVADKGDVAATVIDAAFDAVTAKKLDAKLSALVAAKVETLPADWQTAKALEPIGEVKAKT